MLMKTLAALSISAVSLAIAAEAGTSSSTDFLKFVEFNARYGRSYASVDDHNDRFATFQTNLRLIEDHNSRAETVGFKMGINQFSDLSMDQFLSIYGMQEHHKKLAAPRITTKDVVKKTEKGRTERYDGGER